MSPVRRVGSEPGLAPSQQRVYLSRRERQVRWGMIGSSVFLGVALRQYRGPILGWSCPIYHWTGIPCPTCGMTRSVLAIVRGDWFQSTTFHLFGPLLLIGCGLALGHLVLELCTGKHLGDWYLRWFCNLKIQGLGLIVYLTYYLLRLLYWSREGEFFVPVTALLS